MLVAVTISVCEQQEMFHQLSSYYGKWEEKEFLVTPMRTATTCYYTCAYRTVRASVGYSSWRLRPPATHAQWHLFRRATIDISLNYFKNITLSSFWIIGERTVRTGLMYRVHIAAGVRTKVPMASDIPAARGLGRRRRFQERMASRMSGSWNTGRNIDKKVDRRTDHRDARHRRYLSTQLISLVIINHVTVTTLQFAPSIEFFVSFYIWG